MIVFLFPSFIISQLLSCSPSHSSSCSALFPYISTHSSRSSTSLAVCLFLFIHFHLTLFLSSSYSMYISSIFFYYYTLFTYSYLSLCLLRPTRQNEYHKEGHIERKAITKHQNNIRVIRIL